MHSYIKERKTLGLISASKCNLNCSYCYLHKNQSYINEDEKIIKAMQDGTYLENIKLTLEALHIRPTEFTTLELWGAETSLHISENKDFFKSVIEYLPNLDEITYSTNFMTNIQNHLDFIDIAEQYCEKPVRFRIQISVDGPDYILMRTRHIKYEQIDKNLADFIYTINNKKLKKVDLFVYYKATLPWKIFHEICSDETKTEDYIKFWHDKNNYFNDLIINKNMGFGTSACYGPSLEYPYPYTIQDGVDIAHFANKIEHSDLEKKYGYCNMPLLSLGLTPEMEKTKFYHQSGCGQMYVNLIIKHDGNLSPCSNGFLDLDKDNIAWLKEHDEKEYKTVLNTATFAPDLGKDGKVDREALQKLYSKMQKFWLYQPNFCITNINSQMYELAKAGQISRIYKDDPSYCFNHSLLIFQRSACYFNNLKSNASPYIPSSDLIKLYCNGLMEFYENNKRSSYND